MSTYNQYMQVLIQVSAVIMTQRGRKIYISMYNLYMEVLIHAPRNSFCS